MKIARLLTSIGAPLLTACSILLIAGCGGDGFGKRYQVRGTITYKGEPVPKGNIYFVPDDAANGRAAEGAIQNGQYTLSTIGQEDGAFPGGYKVRIVAVEADYSQVEANRGGGAGRQDDVYKATASAKNLVPPKYQEVSTSGLTAKVEAKSNTIDFPLAD